VQICATPDYRINESCAWAQNEWGLGVTVGRWSIYSGRKCDASGSGNNGLIAL